MPCGAFCVYLFWSAKYTFACGLFVLVLECLSLYLCSLSSAEPPEADDVLSQHWGSSTQQRGGNLVQVLPICVGYMPKNGKGDVKFFELSVYHFPQGVEFFFFEGLGEGWILLKVLSFYYYKIYSITKPLAWTDPRPAIPHLLRVQSSLPLVFQLLLQRWKKQHLNYFFKGISFFSSYS